MEKHKYNIQELENYLIARKAGQINPQMEQYINNDPFLKTVTIGLEKRLQDNNNCAVAEDLEAKKQHLWSTLQLLPSISNNTITTSKNYTFIESVFNYFSLKHYNPHYLRIHLLLGFNCSCVFLLVLIACWLNNSEDAALLVSHLDGLVGYRP